MSYVPPIPPIKRPKAFIGLNAEQLKKKYKKFPHIELKEEFLFLLYADDSAYSEVEKNQLIDFLLYDKKINFYINPVYQEQKIAHLHESFTAYSEKDGNSYEKIELAYALNNNYITAFSYKNSNLFDLASFVSRELNQKERMLEFVLNKTFRMFNKTESLLLTALFFNKAEYFETIINHKNFNPTQLLTKYLNNYKFTDKVGDNIKQIESLMLKRI